MAMNKWIPTTDLLMLRRMGKLSEELGELQAVVARVIIQGIDEVDPGSGKVNRERLMNEIADVMAQCEVTIETLKLTGWKIVDRIEHKKKLMAEWEALFGTPTIGASHD